MNAAEFERDMAWKLPGLTHLQTLVAQRDKKPSWISGSAAWRYCARYDFSYPAGSGFSAGALEKLRILAARELTLKGWHVAGSAWKASPEPHIIVEVSFIEIPIQMQEQFEPGSRPIRWYEKILLWWMS